MWWWARMRPSAFRTPHSAFRCWGPCEKRWLIGSVFDWINSIKLEMTQQVELNRSGQWVNRLVNSLMKLVNEAMKQKRRSGRLCPRLEEVGGPRGGRGRKRRKCCNICVHDVVDVERVFLFRSRWHRFETKRPEEWNSGHVEHLAVKDALTLTRRWPTPSLSTNRALIKP